LNEFSSALTYAKSVTEKNNSRVHCAEAAKKTMQAQRNEGRGFLATGEKPAELPVIDLQVKPDRLQLTMLLIKYFIECLKGNS